MTDRSETIYLRMEALDFGCVASSIYVEIKEGTTEFDARRILLQEIIHCLDYYALDEIVSHLKMRNIVQS